jgi:asparagine synthase (glutamine-hydrolysing)
VSYSFLSSVDQQDLFTADFLSSLNGNHPLAAARRHYGSPSLQAPLNRWLYMDLKMTISDCDLRKVTRMSELAGVTARYPLLDPDLVEFAGSIPTSLKVKGNQLRYIFKKGMQRILPQEILTKTKHGFGLPYSVWLGEVEALRVLTFDVLGSARCRHRGYFRADFLEWVWKQYQTVHKQFFGEVLWVALMLELWHLHHHAPVAVSSSR